MAMAPPALRQLRPPRPSRRAKLPPSLSPSHSSCIMIDVHALGHLHLLIAFVCDAFQTRSPSQKRAFHSDVGPTACTQSSLHLHLETPFQCSHPDAALSFARIQHPRRPCPCTGASGLWYGLWVLLWSSAPVVHLPVGRQVNRRLSRSISIAARLVQGSLHVHCCSSLAANHHMRRPQTHDKLISSMARE